MVVTFYSLKCLGIANTMPLPLWLSQCIDAKEKQTNTKPRIFLLHDWSARRENMELTRVVPLSNSVVLNFPGAATL